MNLSHTRFWLPWALSQVSGMAFKARNCLGGQLEAHRGIRRIGKKTDEQVQRP